jgi:hypothetical protein
VGGEEDAARAVEEIKFWYFIGSKDDQNLDQNIVCNVSRCNQSGKRRIHGGIQIWIQNAREAP